jgi:hypothetical protein
MVCTDLLKGNVLEKNFCRTSSEIMKRISGTEFIKIITDEEECLSSSFTRIRNVSFSHPTSKSPSRHVVSLRGNLKLTETEKIYIFLIFFTYFSIPMYQLSADFSG